MDAQKLIDQKYTNLCTQLGALTVQKNAVDSAVQELTMQIKALESVAPEIKKIESQLKALNAQDKKGDS